MKITHSLCLLAALVLCSLNSSAQNPYLPLWEHIPDAEPHVFEDPDRPGEYRVYIYGSHDNLRSSYCGLDQVVWSAPVNDLRNWRYDGVIFSLTRGADGSVINPDGDVLFAPDVVETWENGQKVYYLAPNDQAGGRQNLIAKSKRPDGPFVTCNWNEDGRSTYGILGFDPAFFRDDDGRVYGYWGFGTSHGAELDPGTMCTLKAGTRVVDNMIPGHRQEGEFRFFEASSMRKIMGKYVFVYSRFTREGEFGLPTTNYTLAYAYGDSPLGPFTYGGTLIDARGRGVDGNGRVIATAQPAGNTHGSLCEINGQWYLFYHRQTGTNEFSRQAMVAPVEISLENGKLLISEAEYTSEGFCTDGLDPFERQAAGYMCYFTQPEPMVHEYPNNSFSGSYVKATYREDEGQDASYSFNYHHSPVINNTAGSVIAYKYFNMERLGGMEEAVLELNLKPLGVEGEIIFMLGSPFGGREIGRLHLSGKEPLQEDIFRVPLSGFGGLGGKQALYMEFASGTEGESLCEFYDFIFREK